MKASGKCPKCQGTEIYTDKGCTKRGDRVSIGFSSWKKFFVDTYLYVTCGYIEEYVEQNDLKDEKKRTVLGENWKKHNISS